MKARDNKGQSIIAFPDEYVCVDVETTGLSFENDEIIEIGAVRVKNDLIIDTYSELVKPSISHGIITSKVLNSYGVSSFSDLSYEDANRFYKTHLISDETEKLTGITNEELLKASNQSIVVESFCKFIKDSILVGHNVNFDINFLYDLFEKYNLSLPNSYIDTMRIARKLHPNLEHHRLSDLADIYGIAQVNKHRALDDAYTDCQCFIAMKREIEKQSSIDTFVKHFNWKPSSGLSDTMADYLAFQTKLSSLKPTTDNFDANNALYNKIVVFTGELTHSTREEAFQTVLNLGGTPSEHVTKKTNYVVVGNGGFKISSSDGKSSKIKKAENYIAKGANISIVNEDDFFAMIK